MDVESKHLLISLGPPAERWTPDEFHRNVGRISDLGCTMAEIGLKWKDVQAVEPGAADFSRIDWAVARLRARKMPFGIAVNHSAPPPWVDAETYCARDAQGKLVVDPGTGEPMVAQNSKQVRDWVGDFLKTCADHFGNAPSYISVTSTPCGEAAWRHPSGLLFDHSRWAAEAFRVWLRGKYADIRILNETWNSGYKAWEEIEPGEGVRRSMLCDFHMFRYATLSLWTARMRAVLTESRAGSVLAFRSGGVDIEKDLKQMAFDLGKYVQASDMYLANQAREPWLLNMIRTAAALHRRPWGVRISPERGDWGDIPGVNRSLSEWGKAIFALGGMVDVGDFCWSGADPERAPGNWHDASVWTFCNELKNAALLAAAHGRSNRKAVYMSAAEVQFWDGTDFEAVRNRWNELTDGGKKPSVDIVSDSMFISSPQVLKAYGGGIEIPFARVISREARAALSQAAGLGVRFMFLAPEAAGTLDEHGRPQPPMAG